MKEEGEQVSMLNFGRKMPLMNRNCFMVSTQQNPLLIFLKMKVLLKIL
jgi:hypothetical protein